jgi:flagellar assembly factor FliW
MKVESPLFGTVDVDSHKIIHFEKGIPGFLDEKEFVFLSFPETPFYVMQSTKNELYFFVINPFDFFKDYEFDIPEAIVEQLEIKEREKVVAYSIVTIKDPFDQSTANLQAPVIINAEGQTGIQLVLDTKKFNIRQPIFTPVTI